MVSVTCVSNGQNPMRKCYLRNGEKQGILVDTI